MKKEPIKSYRFDKSNGIGISDGIGVLNYLDSILMNDYLLTFSTK